MKNIDILNKVFGEIDRKIVSKKLTAFFVLLIFNFRLFSEIVVDPVSISNARATKTASGVDQLDISTPNINGTSYNSLKELQVGERGLVLNNNKHIIVNTEIAGMVARNRNLDNGITANLIITEITGKNRTAVNGAVEVAGDTADFVLANRNGVILGGARFINMDRVTVTTGALQMNNGDLVGIDVEQGHIRIGSKGVDALSLTDLELLSKTIDIDGLIKASNETKLLISSGSQTYTYKTKEVKSKGKNYRGIAVDGKSAGSMYAGKIDIISNDKGAGVNTKGDLVSVDDITLTASGDITTGKVATNKTVKYKTTGKVRVKGETVAGKRVVVKAPKVEIDAKVITGFLEKNLGESVFGLESEKTKITEKGSIQADGKVDIRSKFTENRGEIYSTEKVTVEGEKLDNSKGEISSEGKIDLKVSETVNKKGYILSDGLRKEDIENEKNDDNSGKESTGTENKISKEIGIAIQGSLNNREGVVRGREVTVGGNLIENSKGKIESIGTLNLNGTEINNRHGFISGAIEKLNTQKLINDEGKFISTSRIEGIINKISNRGGKISAYDSVKIIGEYLNNTAGEIRSLSKIDLNIAEINNERGYILSDGLTKEEAEKIEENVASENQSSSSTEKGINILGNINNREGLIKGREVSITGNVSSNTGGVIQSQGKVNIDGNINNAKGYVLSEGITRTEADNWAKRVMREASEELNNDKSELEETKPERTTATGININSKYINNNDGIIASRSENFLNVEKIDNKNGNIVSEGNVELTVLGDYIYEGNVYGDISTKLEGRTVTFNEAVNRNNALYIVGNEKIILKDDIVSKILSLKTSGGLPNDKLIKGLSSLYIESGNILNSGNILSEGSLYIKSAGRVKNSEIGLIQGAKDSYIEGTVIENNRGKILSNGSLSLIAETLIRNNLGVIDSEGTMYAEVRNGRFENIGESHVNIKEHIITEEIPIIGSGYGLKKKVRTRTEQRAERVPEIILNDSIITSEESIVLNVNGDVINKDGGNITAKEYLQIKADNVYNAGKYVKDTQSNLTLLGGGGQLRGADVYLEVKGKVVNGTEEYLNGTYRRADGVLVDNRKTLALNNSGIVGTNSTVIKAGELVNTSQIGASETGTVYIETRGKVTNASIGENVSKILGAEVYVNGASGVHNIGGEINGSKGLQVVSENGKVLNETTINSETKYRETLNRRGKTLLWSLESKKEVESVTENIRNIGKLVSGGTTYVEGKTVENAAGAIQGLEGTYIKGKEDIDDRTINLSFKGKNVVETTTEKRKVGDITGNYPKHGRESGLISKYDSEKEVEVQVQTGWDDLERTNTVSGIIGKKGNTILEAGRNITLESSDIRAMEGDIVLNAKNYLLMLSTVDTEYKYRQEIHKSGGGLRKKKVTTNTWIEDNIYADGVDLTTDGNILMNYHGVGAPADNRGIFAQGVNFNAEGRVLGLSDGDIFIQGTKDILNSVFNSQTRKSWLGFTYRKSGDHININQERYKLSQLYGNAGIDMDSEGKLKIEGVDIQSVGNVFLRGKMGVEILSGVEKYSRYEEHKKSGFKISASSGGLFAGVEKEKSRQLKSGLNNVGTIINSHNGTVNIVGEYVLSEGSKIGAKEDIILNGKSGVVIKDAENLISVIQDYQKTRSGVYASVDKKNWGASAGIEGRYSANSSNELIISPERSILVSDRNILIRSNDGSVLLQGEIGAGENIGVWAENGKILIRDSGMKVTSGSESVEARVSFGLNLSLGGIKDTVKSYRDAYKALKEVPNAGKVFSFIKDIVKGESLIESLEGREDTINAMTTLFNGPSSGGVSAGLGLNISFNNAKSASEYLQNITTNVRAGKDISFKSNEFVTEGGFIRAENDLELETDKIKIGASLDSYRANGKSIGANLGMTFMGSKGFSVGADYGEVNSEGTIYNNSHMQAGNKLTVKADDMTVRGGRLEGRHTDIVINGNLVIESLQDNEKMKQIGISAGYSFQPGKYKKENGDEVPDNRSSVNLGGSLGGGEKLWVREQSGIVGTESINVSVGGKTGLTGGIIANVENGQDKGNLKFKTGELETRDLHNYDKMTNINGNISIAQRGVGNNKEFKVIRAGGRLTGRKAVPNVFDEKYSIGADGHRNEKISRATIGNGNLVIGSHVGSLNRDISKTEEITRNSVAQPTVAFFDSEPHSWGDLSKIMASNAGVIGKFLDDVTNNGVMEYEIKYRDTVYRIITEVENKIAGKNHSSLIPTNKHDGGILEQIPRLFRKDKNDVVEAKFREDEEGKIIIRLRDASGISEVDSDRVFGNGITEVLTKAVSNTIGKMTDSEMIEGLKKGEEYTLILLHNRSRGTASDWLESIAGKVFDGSGSSFGLSIGVSRGQIEALLTGGNKPINVVIYSQGNLVSLGATNSGMDMTGITTRNMGSPVANAETKRSIEKVGGKVDGSALNRGDIIGDNENLIGFFIGETNDITLDNDRKAERSPWQIFLSNLPILKSVTRYENGIIFNNRPVIEGDYETTEKYYSGLNREYWNDKGNYVLSNKDIVEIARNHKDGLLKEHINVNKINIDNMSDYEIAASREVRRGIEEILKNNHRRYTYNSPIYSERIYTSINEYRNGILGYNAAQEIIERNERGNQLDFVDMLKKGPGVWENSASVNKAADDLLYSRMVASYENGVYRNTGLVNYIPIQPDREEYIRKDISVLEISDYLNRLKEEVRR